MDMMKWVTLMALWLCTSVLFIGASVMYSCWKHEEFYHWCVQADIFSTTVCDKSRENLNGLLRPEDSLVTIYITVAFCCWNLILCLVCSCFFSDSQTQKAPLTSYTYGRVSASPLCGNNSPGLPFRK